MTSALEKRSTNESVKDFYNGKSILITGANGFLGLVLLETLLRCCTGIKCIFIVLRQRRGKSEEERMEEMFQKKLFEPLKEQNPDVFKKVHLVPGEIANPDLGMNPDDLQRICNEVSIVFHCAASISFLKPLRFLLTANVLSTNNVIELCRKLKKFEVLVYTSTQYSNCNRHGIVIKEQVQRLPYQAQDFLDALKKDDDVELSLLHSQCLPEWPNIYTFSKCLSENLIRDNASDLKCAVIRPSLISSVWKEPLTGFAEVNSSLAQLTIGSGKGFIKVLLADEDCVLDVIPVDVVANAHIVAAWRTATERSLSPLIVNCTSRGSVDIILREFQKTFEKFHRQYPIPKAFSKYSYVHIVRSHFMYRFWTIYEHYIPAIVLDVILRLCGKKARLVGMYKFYDSAAHTSYPFLTQNWTYETKNLQSLEELNPEDKKLFYTNLSGFNAEVFAYSLPIGFPGLDWSIDERTKEERQRVIEKRYYLIKGIQYVFLLCMFWLLYTIFSQVFL